MITTENLTKNYNDFNALNALNLHVNAGEIYCLLGANGAGKTTTINLLLSLIKPTNGKALINGIDVHKEPIKSKKHLAYIPENLMLYQNLTAFENLKFFSGIATNSKLTKSQLENYLIEAGLQSSALHKQIKNFSKGMRQKVGIAIALAKEAKVLLLDEPTSGLDPKAGNEFGVILQKLKEKKVAVLMATHDLFRAKEIASNIGIMKSGNLLHDMDSTNISLKELEELYLATMKTESHV